jgi:tetratricopeptide (TPR) repeat protein
VLALRERLAAQEPSNSQWQRELAVSQEHIGAVCVELAQYDEALGAMRKGLEITSRLAQQDPANAGWQRDLAVSLAVIARVYERRGNPEQAMASLDEARPIAEKLAALDPKNIEWKDHLAYIEYDRGRLLEIAGRNAEARAAYRKVLDVAGRAPDTHAAQKEPETMESLRENATQALGRAPAALQSVRRAGTPEPAAPGKPAPGDPALLESQRQAKRKNQAPPAPALRHERPRPGNDPLEALY